MAVTAPVTHTTEGICFANTFLWGVSNRYSQPHELEPLRLAYTAYQHEEGPRYQYLSPVTLTMHNITESTQDMTHTGLPDIAHFKPGEFSILCYYFDNPTPPHCLGIKVAQDNKVQLFDHQDIHCAQGDFPKIPIPILNQAVTAYIRAQTLQSGPIKQMILATYAPISH